ncbi:hypothetical protein FB451DRAFT_1163938 [Mycena latifolia]|nr:hypothetical protein FB451DRAFT_1163938 [Mycena latifolia]
MLEVMWGIFEIQGVCKNRSQWGGVIFDYEEQRRYSRLHTRIGSMLFRRKLPPQLQSVLLNPRILDLAQLAKERLVVSSAKIGLADLCAKILGKRVDKNVAERISSAWEGELSKSQIRYASLDVYACHCIYDSFVKIPVPSLLPDPVPLGTPILLFHDGHSRLIARGTVASLEGSYDTINITRTRCLIEVTEIIVPAAIITTHKRTSLVDFGPVPFRAVCLRSHLRLATELNLPSSAAPLSPPVPAESTSPPLLLSSGSEDEEPGLGVLLSQEFDSAGIHDPNTLQSYESDSQSKEEGSKVLADALHRWGIWKTCIQSRVIKDAFHIFNMFYISVVHGLRIEFARALRDAIFIPDAADKARIIAWGLRQSPPKDWATLLHTSSQWLWRQSKVFEVFGHLKDARTGLPLFNSAAWAFAKNVLELIQKGFCSDPPGISLYSVRGYGKDGLSLLHCKRGTNMTEGGVHTWLRTSLPTSGASVRHINDALKDFILRHHLVVGTFNRTGRRFKGHYSIWLTNEIQELLSYLEDIVADRPLTGWVNGNLYQPTNEVSGVLPIPDDIHISSGMARFESSLDSARYTTILLHYRVQGKQSSQSTVLRKRPSFVQRAITVWNANADTREDIYYKLPEQLKVYYSGDWQTNSNIKQTKAVTAAARAPLMKQIHDPRRLELASGMLSLETAGDGDTNLAGIQSQTGAPSLSSGTSSTSPSAPIGVIAGPSGATADSAPVNTPLLEMTQPAILAELSKRRVEATLHESEPPAKRAQRERTCSGKLSCKRRKTRCMLCAHHVSEMMRSWWCRNSNATAAARPRGNGKGNCPSCCNAARIALHGAGDALPAPEEVAGRGQGKRHTVGGNTVKVPPRNAGDSHRRSPRVPAQRVRGGPQAQQECGVYTRHHSLDEGRR